MQLSGPTPLAPADRHPLALATQCSLDHGMRGKSGIGGLIRLGKERANAFLPASVAPTSPSISRAAANYQATNAPSRSSPSPSHISTTFGGICMAQAKHTPTLKLPLLSDRAAQHLRAEDYGEAIPRSTDPSIRKSLTDHCKCSLSFPRGDSGHHLQPIMVLGFLRGACERHWLHTTCTCRRGKNAGSLAGTSAIPAPRLGGRC